MSDSEAIRGGYKSTIKGDQISYEKIKEDCAPLELQSVPVTSANKEEVKAIWPPYLDHVIDKDDVGFLELLESKGFK